MMKKRIMFRSIGLCVLALMVLGIGGLAFKTAEAMLFTPSRIIFGPKDRSKTLTVKNTSEEALIYTFSFETFKLTDDGLQNVAEGEDVVGLKPVEPYIRFAPRRLILKPGQIQTIRFLAMRPQNMEDGEYRSYFKIHSDYLPQSIEEERNSGGQAIQSSLKMLINWNLPVILRHGETSASVSFVSAKFAKHKNGKDILRYTLKREGNRSLIGNVESYCVSANDQKLGQAQMKIYTEQTEATAFQFVDLPSEGCAEIRMTFTAETADPQYSDDVMATKIFKF